MHPPGLRVDMVLQRIRVGGFELGELPPIQNPRGQRGTLRMAVFQRGDILQHIGTCRIGTCLALLPAGHAHLIEQHLAQLLGAAHVEGAACQRLDLVLQPGHLLGKGVRHAAEGVAVNLYAVHLHLGQHRHKRALQRLVDGGHGRAV